MNAAIRSAVAARERQRPTLPAPKVNLHGAGEDFNYDLYQAFARGQRRMRHPAIERRSI
jgi:hypothetical protein